MKVAITGANRGIGLSLARTYSSQGHKVYGLCRKKSTELEGLDNCKIVEGIDVTDPEASSKLEQALGKDKIDIFINNAGVLESDNLDSLNYDELHKQLVVNSIGPILMVKNILPYIKEGGKIGVLTSRMGSIEDNTSGGYYGYRMSKAAANAGCKSLALDLKPQRIAVVALHPGYVRTEMTGNNGDIEPGEAAEGIYKVMDKLKMQDSGSFLHSNGSKLSW